MKHIVHSIILVITLFSCVSHEKKMLKKYGEQPTWASKTPSSQSYYYGIGIVNKNVADYRNAATKVALDNLVNEISVNVSSTSLFTTQETTESFNQEFSQNIHLSSKETIEGYEMVDSWENENTYFVFYQLSKAKHKQLKAKRIKLALERSKKMFLAAVSLKETGNYKQALVNEIQAFEVLNPFLDQDLNTEIDGKQVNLAVHIVHTIKKLENDVKITPSFTEKKLKVGQSISAKELFATISDQQGKMLSNMPVLFKYKAVSTKKKTVISNEDGIAYYQLNKVKSNKSHQVITIAIDFESIIKDATQNRLIRKIINYQQTGKVQINLHVKSPSVFIKGAELFNKEPSETSTLAFTIQRALIDNKFNISPDAAGADLILEYNLNSRTVRENENMVMVSSAGTVTVTEKNNIIFSHNIPDQKGTHLTPLEALDKANKKIQKQIQKKIIPIFSGKYFNY